MNRNEKMCLAVQAIKDNPDLLDFEAVEGSWPKLLKEIQTLIAAVLKKDSVDDCNGLSSRLTLELAMLTGGMQTYLPQGDKLCDRIIYLLMKKEFNGKNYFEISRRYKTSEQLVRDIIHDRR